MWWLAVISQVVDFATVWLQNQFWGLSLVSQCTDGPRRLVNGPPLPSPIGFATGLFFDCLTSFSWVWEHWLRMTEVLEATSEMNTRSLSICTRAPTRGWSGRVRARANPLRGRERYAIEASSHRGDYWTWLWAFDKAACQVLTYTNHITFWLLSILQIHGNTI